MPTPKQIYESDVYRQLASEPQETVPWSFFLDVYEALGRALAAKDEANEPVEIKK